MWASANAPCSARSPRRMRMGIKIPVRGYCGERLHKSLVYGLGDSSIPDLPIALPFDIRHHGSGNTCHVFRIPASGTTNRRRPEPDRTRGMSAAARGKPLLVGLRSGVEALFCFQRCRPLLRGANAREQAVDTFIAEVLNQAWTEQV